MKKFLSIFLIFVFLFPSSGFSYSTHICGGEIHRQGFSVFGMELRCEMDGSDDPCMDDESMGMDKGKKEMKMGMENMSEDKCCQNGCCQNVFENYKMSEEFQATFYNIEFNYQFIAAFTISQIKLFTIKNENYSNYLFYRPPIPDKDIPVLIQSFLI